MITGGPATSRWRRAGPLVLIGVAIVATSVLLAVIAARPQPGTLDPGAATPDGSRALAELLRDQGVTISSVETFADAEAQLAGSSATLLVTVPDRIPPDRLAALAERAAAVILVEPTVLERVMPGVTTAGFTRVESREPGCMLPAAVAAGPADAGGITYTVADRDIAAARCYAVGGRPSVVRLEDGGRPITAIGTAAPFTNDRLDQHGNAALTMRLLGEQPRLVWYRPAVGEALGGGDSSLVDLLPSGWKWAASQLLVAVALLAVWRARRLGPIVTEPLPVVVRAAEAVEGRGRLYRRVRARDRAAEALRDASRARLRRPLGLGRSVSSGPLVDAVARRTDRTDADVSALLYGAPPQDDRALVRLADELDALEREVQRS